MKEIKIHFSRTGSPCLWESGGGLTRRGNAQLIGDLYGRQKRALYVPRGGHLACGDHALIPVRKGDTVALAGRQSVTVYEIVALGNETATLRPLGGYGEGEWDANFPDHLRPIAQMAMKKAGTYHCREAMWINHWYCGKEVKA